MFSLGNWIHIFLSALFNPLHQVSLYTIPIDSDVMKRRSAYWVIQTSSIHTLLINSSPKS
jgi:hypothetical protein